MTSPQAPQSLLKYYESVEKGSNRRFDLQLSANAKQAKAQLDMQYKIAKLNASTEQERIAVDRWYKEQQVQLAEKTFGESVRQFDKEFGLNEGDLTGFYGGNPTLARQKYEADKALAEGQMTGYFGGNPTMERQQMEAGLTGLFNGQQTLQARELERRFGLAEGELTGTYQGAPTEAKRQFDKQFGLSEAGVTGMYQGQQTLEAQELARRFGLDTQKFGLDVASTAAQMRARPDMIFQYQQFQRDLPGLLQGRGGAPNSGIMGAPQGQTIQGQLAELGYLSAAMPQAGSESGGGAPGGAAVRGGGDMMYAGGTPGSIDPTLAALGNVYKQGFQKLGAQSLEQFSPNELGFMSSAGTYLGYDPQEELRKYQGSRLGQ